MPNNQEIQPNYKYYDLVGMAFIAVVLISTIAAQKLFALFDFTLTAGILVFPFAYIFGDCLTEVYGYAKARRIVWTGFAANVFMAVVLSAAVALPPAPGWPFQEQFATALGMVPRIVVASLAAYLVGEFANAYVIAKMKVMTQGRHLWMRTISSTIVGQALDSIVFVLVAFAGIFPLSVLLATMFSGYLFKVIYEVAATPLTYWVVSFLKRVENVDFYDRKTNFTPFKID